MYKRQAGTYPLWHSPGYWYAGAKTVFNLHLQLLSIKTSAHELLEIPMRSIGSDGFIGGAILLFVLSLGKNKRTHRARMPFWLVGWPLVACGMYSLVWAHWRYVAVFLLLLCLEAYRSLVFRVEKRVAVLVCAIALLVAMAPLAHLVATSLETTASELRQPVDEDYIVVAHKLQHLGLQPGDKLAFVGNAGHPYYARYDRLQVVSQIEDPDEFWRLNPAEAKRVEDRIASIDVKALLAFDHPANFQEGRWVEIGPIDGKPFSVSLLQPAKDPSR